MEKYEANDIKLSIGCVMSIVLDHCHGYIGLPASIEAGFSLTPKWPF